VLLLDDLTSDREDLNLHSITHGVLRLEQLAVLYGSERRRLRVLKLRATAFRGGFHDFTIRQGGLIVFPRLNAAEHLRELQHRGPVTSNIPELDTLLGGGLDRGTSTLLIGPSGSGKSTLALQYIMAALERREKVAIFSFDEARHVVLQRALGLGHDLRPYLEDRGLILERVNPAELSPGEFACRVRAAVENERAAMVVIDSLNGYLSAMPEEQFVTLQMHELLTYLNQQGVLTIMILAQQGLVGPMQTPMDLTYLSDAVLLLRFFEATGEIRRAVSVIKKRTGPHERSIREYRIDGEGLRVGPPLAEFQGILTGVPTYTGPAAPLLKDRPA
jgi:circadian clock protein KaiC